MRNVIRDPMTHDHEDELVLFRVGLSADGWTRPDLWLPPHRAESLSIATPAMGPARATAVVQEPHGGGGGRERMAAVETSAHTSAPSSRRKAGEVL
ncbi:hypothetical protein ELQ92_00680 [Labedella populi]|uniref:Uncharacterized protein n=1 Tax=Labedella populi TaxID=2498850 RepID=A0A444QE30_9MICO|nr:hypothetical protein [Labedella populi]RWZ67823.1 hypothetical protein ELQ92_00680 [Labedella populi]